MDILLKISAAFNYNKINIIVICKRKSGQDISFYQLQRKKKTVDICDKQESLDSIHGINGINKKHPLIICYQGTGLVQRIIKNNLGDFSQIIPNINIKDYLISSREINHDEKLVVLCRRDLIEKMICSSEIKRLPVHSVTLGFNDVSQYVQLFPEKVNEFVLEENVLGFENGRIESIQKVQQHNNQNYLFANNMRTASEIVALTAGLEYFTKKKWNTFDLPLIKENVKEHTAYKISFYMLYYFGLILFLLLLLNFALFENFKAKNLILKNHSQEIASIENEINSLQNEINSKKLFIQENQVPDNYAFSFYIDQLASCVPDRILLSKLTVSPIEGKIKDGKLIKVHSKTMFITGTSIDQIAFSQFISILNDSYWVKKLNKQVYSFNSENNSGVFELEIILNDAIN